MTPARRSAARHSCPCRGPPATCQTREVFSAHGGRSLVQAAAVVVQRIAIAEWQCAGRERDLPGLFQAAINLEIERIGRLDRDIRQSRRPVAADAVAGKKGWRRHPRHRPRPCGSQARRAAEQATLEQSRSVAAQTNRAGVTAAAALEARSDDATAVHYRVSAWKDHPSRG